VYYYVSEHQTLRSSALYFVFALMTTGLVISWAATGDDSGRSREEGSEGAEGREQSIEL
jgi:hypothetical protein